MQHTEKQACTLGYIWDTVKYTGIQLGYMEQQMADRKNLKVSEETHELLTAVKREGETWDGLFQRLVAEHADATVAEIKEALREVLREEEVIDDA